jgi:proteasome alpha subunit
MAGVDDTRPRLFESDPSGALLEYKATAIGAGRNTFMEVFEAEYRGDLSIDEAILLGMTALYKSTEGKIDAATLEVGVVTLQDRTFRKLAEEEVQQYVSKVIEEQKKEVKEETESVSENGPAGE